MPDRVTLTVDGHAVTVPAGATVAAAVAIAGGAVTRRSVRGEPRGPLCGMGVCFECRVTIGGERHQRACMVLSQAGMEVRTGE
jgi:predicted molibdopterin-dependent oxidoreductase YjgC